MNLAGELGGLAWSGAAPNAARQVRRGMWWLRRCKAQSIKAGCNTCPTCSATSSVASPCSAASVVSVALQSQGQRQNRPSREPAQRRRWRAHAQALLLRDDPVRQCGQQGVDTLRPVVGVQVGNAVPLAPILGCRLGSGSCIQRRCGWRPCRSTCPPKSMRRIGCQDRCLRKLCTQRLCQGRKRLGVFAPTMQQDQLFRAALAGHPLDRQVHAGIVALAPTPSASGPQVKPASQASAALRMAVIKPRHKPRLQLG